MKPRQKKPLVTAIVPAYNEEERIGAVLDCLHKTALIDHIIVIDDGSSDQTGKIARSKLVTYFRLTKNSGKSEAIKYGLHHVSTDYVFMCDADLQQLTPDICTNIITPVLKRNVDMSIGMQNYGWLLNQLFIHLPSISGQRALPTKLLRTCIQSSFSTRYGIELVLDYYCSKHNKNVISNIYRQSNTHLLIKRGFIEGSKQVIKQVAQLIQITIAIVLLKEKII